MSRWFLEFLSVKCNRRDISQPTRDKMATLVIPEVNTVCTSVLLGRYFGIHATVYGSAYSPFSAHQARYHSQSMPSTRGSKAQSAHGISP